MPGPLRQPLLAKSHSSTFIGIDSLTSALTWQACFRNQKKEITCKFCETNYMGTHTHKFQASVLRLVSCVHKLEGKVFSLESVSAVLKTTTENLAKSIHNPVSFLPTISPEVPRISSMPLNCIQFHRAKMTQPDQKESHLNQLLFIALVNRQFFEIRPINGHSS